MMDWLVQNAGLAGLLFFFGFFVVMAVWVYRPGAKAGYQDKAGIPLRDNGAHHE